MNQMKFVDNALPMVTRACNPILFSYTKEKKTRPETQKNEPRSKDTPQQANKVKEFAPTQQTAFSGKSRNPPEVCWLVHNV